MAIEPIKKLTILSPVQSSRRIMRFISQLGMIDVIDAGERFADEDNRLKTVESSMEEADEELYKIDFIRNLVDSRVPEEKGFFEGLTPLPQIVEQSDINEALEKYDLEKYFFIASEIDEVLRHTERARGEIENQLDELKVFDDLPFRMNDFHGSRRVRLLFGDLSSMNAERLLSPKTPWIYTAFERIDTAFSSYTGSKRGKETEHRQSIVIAILNEHFDEVREALNKLDFHETELPHLSGRIHDRILELRGDLEELNMKRDEALQRARELSRDRRILVTLKAFWLLNRNQQIAATKTLRGKWVHLFMGYIRKKDLPDFEKIFRRDFPESMVTIEDPGAEENVPVSLTLPPILRPLSLLVEMFGLPPYRSFDPTPFLHFNFYLFFGICFSDVGYGVMLVLFSLYLSKKTRQYRGVKDFAHLLLCGGISTILFGALSGSWFGDLYQPGYLGEGNLLLWLQSKFTVIDPVHKTIYALLVALSIGVLNQFYGICLKIYGSFRDGDWKSALFDGFFWLVLLPGFLIMVSRLFVPTPLNLFHAGIWLSAAGAAGLVLTQGRGTRNPFARIMGGFVSLYGIMGSYGITAFIGDTLSYCRLLALGLTTSIVAMTFNMLGGLLRDIPYVGIFLFIAVLVIGHIFNFMISILGAFVHSMRLVFVEFFGRFYETGGRPFQPLGFDSPICILKKQKEKGANVA